MMPPDPQFVPASWDHAVIGGIVCPGLSQIHSGGGRLLKWDKPKGSGTSGVATKFSGADLTSFTLKISFYGGVLGETEFDQRVRWFNDIMPILKKAESGKYAIDFYHPAVSGEPANVTAVVPEEIGTLVQEGDLWTVSVKFIQFVAPKPASGKPKQATKKNQQPSAADQAEADFVNAAKDFNDVLNDFLS